MAGKVSIDLDQVKIAVMLRSEEGVVGRDMARRGRRVAAAAKRRAPRRSGLLAKSIDSKGVRVGGEAAVEVSVGARYAKFVHDGTGVYGPTGAPIRARLGGVLRFRVGGTVVYARSVRGQRGKPFLRDALPSALQ